ncbi:MAG: hypothetical protein Q7T24_02235 [Deltaproteobacteria bacterium]|nr:hypothetical protein [Deltaproteobacteria bacterium]
MLKCLILAVIILSASVSFAQSDSVSKSLDIVNSFHTEAEVLTKGLVSPSFQGQFAGERDEAVNELDSLSWTEKPGKRRFNLAYGIVDSYTEKIIESIEKLLPQAPPKSREALNNAVERLSALKTVAMRELNESLKAEAYEQERSKPVPLIDRSPFEAPPEEAPGMWFR